MEPDFVIQKIVNQVMDGQSGQIVLPENYNFFTTMRGWPLWMQLWLRNFKGNELKLVKDAIDRESAS